MACNSVTLLIPLPKTLPIALASEYYAVPGGCHLSSYPTTWIHSSLCQRHCSPGGACSLLLSLLQLCVHIFPSPSLTILVHLCLVPQPNFKIFSVLPSPHVPTYDQIHYRAFVVYGWSSPFKIGSAQETGTFLLHLVCVVH